MNKDLLYFSVSDMNVYLGECFFRSIPNRPRRLHLHPCFELVCIDNAEGMSFVITPPLLEHFSVNVPNERVISMLFDFPCKESSNICYSLRDIKEQVFIPDVFDGFSRIKSIKKLLQDASYGAKEQIRAELDLFFIGLVRAIYSAKESGSSYVHMLDRERKLRLEEYFNIHLKDPNCSKRHLADEIGVCERQLTRILSEIYASSFSKILLTSRMTLAEAMRKEGGKSAEQISAEVGYTSVVSFKRAYRNFFGFPYISNISQDT